MAFLRAQECENGSKIEMNWCPTSWDGMLCWLSAPPGKVVVQTCPEFDMQANVTRTCQSDGRWNWGTTGRNGSQINETTYNETCDEYSTSPEELPSFDMITSSENYLTIIKCISIIGYVLSLYQLIKALRVMSGIKKLWNSQHILRLYLFASFIVQTLGSLFVEIFLLIAAHRTNELQYYQWQGACCTPPGKAFAVVRYFFLLANSSLVAMDAFHLCTITFLAARPIVGANVKLCVAVAWGSPVVIIALWTLLQLQFENDDCWTLNGIWTILLIRVPMSLVVVCGFALFVAVIRKVSCMPANSSAHDQALHRAKPNGHLIRTILGMIPMFGPQHLILLVFSYFIDHDEGIPLAWLFWSQLFKSFQGFLMSIAYCYSNREVQSYLSSSARRRRQRGTGNELSLVVVTAGALTSNIALP